MRVNTLAYHTLFEIKSQSFFQHFCIIKTLLTRGYDIGSSAHMAHAIPRRNMSAVPIISIICQSNKVLITKWSPSELKEIAAKYAVRKTPFIFAICFAPSESLPALEL